MCTVHSLLYRGSLCPRGSLSRGLGSLSRGVSLQGASVRWVSVQDHGTRDGDPPEGTWDQAARQKVTSCQDCRDPPSRPHKRKMGPGSQTWSDIIQRPTLPVDRMTDASENIALPQASFAEGNIIHQNISVLFYMFIQSTGDEASALPRGHHVAVFLRLADSWHHQPGEGGCPTHRACLP